MATDGNIIWFCQCNTIEPGGCCAKHGYVSEEDRLRRRASAEAHERLKVLASELGGWHFVEKKVWSWRRFLGIE